MEEPKPPKAAEFAYAAMVLLVAAVVWYTANKLPPAPYDPLGPRSFPIATSVLLAGLGIVMLMRLLLGLPLGRARQSLVLGFEAASEHAQRPAAATLTIVLAIAYATALSFRAIPFVVATAVYLFANGLVLSSLDRRRLIGMAVFAVLAAIVLDVVFRMIFRLDLS